MIQKNAGINLEAGDEGILIGYANVYNEKDLQDDISAPGSFIKTVSERKSKIKIYRNHDPDQFVGVPIELDINDPFGLKLTAKMLMDTQAGKDAYLESKFLVENGFESGFSIGGYVMKRDKTNKSLVLEYMLSEISVLTKDPANARSMVEMVKSIDTNINVNDFWQLIEKAYNEQFSDDILKSLETFMTLKGKPGGDSDTTSKLEPSDIIKSIYKQFI